MKIVFMGTPDFAAQSLKALYDGGYDVAAVFTQPDKPKNRGKKLAKSPVKELAEAHGTPVYQPQSFKDGQAVETLREIGPDLIAVVAYGKILPDSVLAVPPMGCINIHGSLLPKYRGSAPIQWSVLNGEKVTGVTSMYLASKMDAGDMIAVKTLEIGEYETAGELFKRLAPLGAQLLCETIDSIAAGTAARIPQNEEEATYAPPLTKEQAELDFSRSCTSLVNQIRGLDPWPVAVAELGGVRLKVFKAEPDAEAAAGKPGEVVYADKRGIGVSCSDGVLRISTVQAPGGKRMAAADYLRGHPIEI
ncbi:MAG: methionyl-tRNA formyltransferase [Oscillospiraceae bacterium]|nr:methionyl-tRNA formyltransferase [Oscillospiraceae bacterium]